MNTIGLDHAFTMAAAIWTTRLGTQLQCDIFCMVHNVVIHYARLKLKTLYV